MKLGVPAPKLGVPSPETVIDACANAWDLFVRGGIADRTPLPASIIAEGPQRTVFRYHQQGGRRVRHAPVLLVPPLAAPASCFDLHRGCSMAEHLLQLGYPLYLVDYGPIAFSDRDLGLEHWVEDVLPTAIREVSKDAGGRAVQLVGWCLGGIMSLLAVAADRTLPVNSVTLIASPFDFRRVRLLAPVRVIGDLTRGQLVGSLNRLLGGAPAPLVSLGFRLTAIDKLLLKPFVLARHLHDREVLAQIEAVDAYMANMLAYPGRTFGQLYHRFFRVNELAGGRIAFGEHVIDLADVEVPVLAIGGEDDVLAPVEAVHHVARLLPNAPEVRLEVAPGGHLGVLTGRAARRTTWAYVDEFLLEHDAFKAAAARAA
jgi:polyhydroxyalkanoate synthase